MTHLDISKKPLASALIQQSKDLSQDHALYQNEPQLLVREAESFVVSFPSGDPVAVGSPEVK